MTDGQAVSVLPEKVGDFGKRDYSRNPHFYAVPGRSDLISLLAAARGICGAKVGCLFYIQVAVKKKGYA